MQVTIPTLAKLKTLRLSQFDTYICLETQREYTLTPNGGSFTPDDLEYVRAAQGGDWRFVALQGRGGGARAATTD